MQSAHIAAIIALASEMRDSMPSVYTRGSAIDHARFQQRLEADDIRRAANKRKPAPKNKKVKARKKRRGY